MRGDLRISGRPLPSSSATSSVLAIREAGKLTSIIWQRKVPQVLSRIKNLFHADWRYRGLIVSATQTRLEIKSITILSFYFQSQAARA